MIISINYCSNEKVTNTIKNGDYSIKKLAGTWISNTHNFKYLLLFSYSRDLSILKIGEKVIENRLYWDGGDFLLKENEIIEEKINVI